MQGPSSTRIFYIRENFIDITQTAIDIETFTKPYTLTNFRYQGWAFREISENFEFNWCLTIRRDGELDGSLIAPSTATGDFYEPAEQVITWGCLHNSILVGPSVQRIEGGTNDLFEVHPGDTLTMIGYAINNTDVGMAIEYEKFN